MLGRSLIHAAVVALCGCITLAGAAGATTYDFIAITSNSANNVNTGQSQLSVDVTSNSANSVAFTFNNSGPLASSITDVYWDDRAGLLSSILSITSSQGVSFAPLATPTNLPAGNTVGFSVNPAGASADSDQPVQPNGVNPGEWLTVIWNLVAGVAFNDVIAALNLGGDQSGSLRIGIHVQGFADGGSESFINTPAPVPIPAAGLLMLGGLVALAALRRRRTA